MGTSVKDEAMYIGLHMTSYCVTQYCHTLILCFSLQQHDIIIRLREEESSYESQISL